MTIRFLKDSDFPDWLRMRKLLWPDIVEEEEAGIMREFLARGNYKVWIAENESGDNIAFIEGQTCNRADGCLSDKIFFVEGWWVDKEYRRQGIGHALMRTAEEWAQANGMKELASDTWLGNEDSHNAHLTFGFQEVDRNVTYRKEL